MKTVTYTELEIIDLLNRGVEDVVVKDHLRKRLLNGEKLRIKFGIDPTSPHMHLGHTVPLRKLRQFQDLGHQAVLIIGDGTAMIGDPTGRTEARKKLSDKEIDENKKTYIQQAGKILNLDKLEVQHNGDWFRTMSAGQFLELTSLVTVQQILQREDFRNRIDDSNHPLSALELAYPVMQGYDSVMVKADVELGGVDQTLNLMMGRRMQRRFDMPEQDVMTVPLLIGTDGERKMSKSFGNAIFLEDPSEEMFAKIMSIPDSLMINYFTLLTDLPTGQIGAIAQELSALKVNPRDIKALLATKIVSSFYGLNTAGMASKAFDKLFKSHETPEDVPVVKMKSAMNILDLLVETKLAPSKGEARRLVDGGGVKVDGAAVTGYDLEVTPSKEGVLIQKGKRHFVRVVRG